MTMFEKREKGFEWGFVHDEDLKFKATARRDKLLGLWAAEKLGLSGAEADAYANELVVADLEEAGDDDVLRKNPQGFCRQGRGAIRSADPADDGRAVGDGHSAGQGREVRSRP